jgi:nucleoside-diphosphate-sugar epimerase
VGKRIVITGAAGNLGRKIASHLESRNDYDLTLLDINPGGDPEIVSADLSRSDDSWEQHFEGVDTVVHMAAEPRPHAPWESLEKLNIDLAINVYSAAVAKGARRLIFASSNAAMGGYRDEKGPITHDLPTRPANYYGVTKVVGERIGKLFSERHGLSVICLRIGAVGTGENRPDPALRHWWQWMWLSNRDLCEAVEKAIDAENVQFAVLNVMSSNAGMRWDLSETRRVLGYEPRDGHVPPPESPRPRLRAWAGRNLRRLCRRCGAM